MCFFVEEEKEKEVCLEEEYCTVQYSTVQYSTVLYCTVQKFVCDMMLIFVPEIYLMLPEVTVPQSTVL